MTLFPGWLDQPGIFLLLDKSRRSHRQVIIFLLEIKLQSSVFSIFGNCQSCILLISFCAHSLCVVNFKLFCLTSTKIDSEKYVDLIKEPCSQLGRLQIRRNQLQRLQDDRRGQTRGDIPADCLTLI